MPNLAKPYMPELSYVPDQTYQILLNWKNQNFFTFPTKHTDNVLRLKLNTELG